jgi:hypothetical protein
MSPFLAESAPQEPRRGNAGFGAQMLVAPIGRWRKTDREISLFFHRNFD